MDSMLVDLLKDSGYLEQIVELQEVIKLENKVLREEKLKKEREKIEKLQRGTNFEIVLVFKEDFGIGLNDFIKIEGFENSIKIFNHYREIGFNLKLHSLSLFLNDELVKKVNFKYK